METGNGVFGGGGGVFFCCDAIVGDGDWGGKHEEGFGGGEEPCYHWMGARGFGLAGR